jgi:peptidoglycan-associated lipoprotein
MKRFVIPVCLVVSFFLLTGCPKKPKKPAEVIPEKPVVEEVKEEPSIRGKEYQNIPELKNILFGYDKYSITPESAEILKKNAEYLKNHPELEVLVEGHCCECGTNEYNMALGQKRATAVRDYYIKLGVPAERIATISYGEERPINKNAGPPDSEGCIVNRRAETKVRAKE